MVEQIDTETGEVIVTYSSTREAARATSVADSNISSCYRGIKRHRTAGGVKWRYVDKSTSTPTDKWQVIRM